MKRNRKNKEKIKRLRYGDLLSNQMEFIDFVSDGIFRLKLNGTEQSIAILRISGIDIFHFLAEDRENTYDNYASATMQLTLPNKYVFTDCSPLLKSQIEFFEYKLQKTKNNYCRMLIQREIDRLKKFELEHRDKLSYLMVFGDEQTLKKETKRFMDSMIDTCIRPCEQNEIMEFLVKYMCFDEKNRSIDMQHIFPEILDVEQSYIKINNKFVAPVVVSGYPAYLKDLQLANLVSSFTNTVTLDVTLRDKNVVIDNINNSLDELKSRGNITQTTGDLMDAGTEFDKLRAIRDDIVNGNEQIRFVTLRFLVSASSLNELQINLEDIKKKFNEIGLDYFIPINQMQKEYESMISSSNIIGNPFPLYNTFARQFPFYYQSLFDPRGTFWGYTTTGGLAYVDTFFKTHNRESYDILITGKKGSGKTITLKELIQSAIMVGNKVFALDVESEYYPLAEVLEGQVIKMTKNSLINVLQLSKSIDESVEDDDTKATNFTSEMSRIAAFFYQYAPNLSDKEADKLKDLIYELYQEFDITEETDISKLSAEDYPILSDLLNLLRKKLYGSEEGIYKKDLNVNQITVLENLEICIKPIAEGMYSNMFNGYTNVNISDNNLIIFDVKNLCEMEDKACNAQLFNILSIMWAATCRNIAYNNTIRHPFDRRFVVSVIDESHRYINARNINVTSYIEKLTRRSRKYFAGLWFASQSALDYSPPGEEEGAAIVNTIFDLVQYKIIMKQSVAEKNIEKLKELFPQFSRTELKNVKKFSEGEMLLAMGEDREKIHCLRNAELSDLMYMGNSLDRERIIQNMFSYMYINYNQEEIKQRIREAPEEFADIFFKEVMQSFKIHPNDSIAFSQIVKTSVNNLVNSLINTGEEVLYGT